MGIKNLKVLLNQYCQSAITNRKLEDYSKYSAENMDDSYRIIFGIDLSIFLHKYLYNNNDHLEGLSRLILRLLKNHITPLFIFDGKPPKEKDNTIKSRKDKRDFMSIKRSINEYAISIDRDNFQDFKNNMLDFIENQNSSYIIDDEEIKNIFDKPINELKIETDKLSKKIIYVTSYHIESSKELFDLFGIKYIHAPCEAESLLAMLCKNNYIHGCISEDTDVLVNGGYLFLRNFNADKNTIDEYCLHGILNNLKITQEQFIDLCILCGCDYTDKIYGMGPITAYKLILNYGTLEEILRNNKKYIIPENFKYDIARELFRNPISKEVFDSIDKKIYIKEPQIDKLLIFLSKTTLKKRHVNEISSNLINYYLNIERIGLSESKKKEDKLKKVLKITDFYKK